MRDITTVPGRRALFLSILRRHLHHNPRRDKIGTRHIMVITPNFHLTSTKYMVCGAHAANQYMRSPRNTSDLDILCYNLASAEAEMLELGALKIGSIATDQLVGSTWLLNGLEVDLMAGDQLWLKAAFNNPNGKYIALPYLVVMKFTAGRAKDMADISVMLANTSSKGVKRVRDIFSRYLKEYIEDLDSLIILSQYE